MHSSTTSLIQQQHKHSASKNSILSSIAYPTQFYSIFFSVLYLQTIQTFYTFYIPIYFLQYIYMFTVMFEISNLITVVTVILFLSLVVHSQNM